MTKVDITTAAHTVIVEADEPLDAVAAKALELWRATRDPKLDQAWGVTAAITERADGPSYIATAGADLGRRG